MKALALDLECQDERPSLHAVAQADNGAEEGYYSAKPEDDDDDGDAGGGGDAEAACIDMESWDLDAMAQGLLNEALVAPTPAPDVAPTPALGGGAPAQTLGGGGGGAANAATPAAVLTPGGTLNVATPAGMLCEPTPRESLQTGSLDGLLAHTPGGSVVVPGAGGTPETGVPPAPVSTGGQWVAA
eukprot:238029-Chlamydomonas_euryale.AAC.18